MEKLAFLQQHHKLAGLGFVLTIPALILVFGGILQSGFGVPQVNEAVNYDLFIFNPIILMGGLGLAFGLNLISVMRVTFQVQDGSLVSTIKIQGKPLNLSLVVFIALLCTTIFLYLLVENFQVFAW